MAKLVGGDSEKGTAKFSLADLSWRTAGDRFRMERPVGEVSLPKAAGGLLRLDNGTSLRLADPDSTAEGVASGEAVTYPNTTEDTDMVVRSLPTGFGVGWSLRSPAAEREIRVPFDLPAGQRLSKTSGGAVAVIDASGEAVTAVTPAVAQDADKQPVAVTTKVDGDAIIYGVDHAQGKVAYPVTVDPYVYSTTWNQAGSTTSIDGWFMQNTPEPSAPYQPIYPNGQQGSILGLYGPAGYYAQNESTAWGRFPPGNPAIPRGPSSGHARWTQFTAGSVGYTIAPTQNYHYYNYASGQIFISDSGGNIKNTVGQLPAPTSGANYTLNASGAGLAVDNVIGFGLTLGPYFFQYDHPASIINIGWFQATVDDPTPPTPSVTGTTQGWLNENSYLTANGSDNGLGISLLGIQKADATPIGSYYSFPCTNVTSQKVCEYSRSVPLPVASAPEGETTQYVVASDTSSSGRAPFPLKLDKSPPEMTVTGSAFDNKATNIPTGTSRNLVLDAADGVPNGTLEQKRSGVRWISVNIDGDIVAQKTIPDSDRADNQSLHYEVPLVGVDALSGDENPDDEITDNQAPIAEPAPNSFDPSAFPEDSTTGPTDPVKVAPGKHSVEIISSDWLGHRHVANFTIGEW